MSNPWKAGIRRGFLCLSIFLVVTVGYIFTFPEFGQAVIRLGTKWGLIIMGPAVLFVLGISVFIGTLAYGEQKFMDKARKEKINFDAWYDKWVVKKRWN